jgi:hypothetical protein
VTCRSSTVGAASNWASVIQVTVSTRPSDRCSVSGSAWKSGSSHSLVKKSGSVSAPGSVASTLRINWKTSTLLIRETRGSPSPSRCSKLASYSVNCPCSVLSINH